MNKKIFANRLALIFTQEQLNRISIEETGCGLDLTIDLHHLRCLQVHVLLRNVLALNHYAFSLHLIHGFNHGTAIKEMLTNEYQKNNRLMGIYSPAWNPGETYIQVTSLF